MDIEKIITSDNRSESVVEESLNRTPIEMMAMYNVLRESLRQYLSALCSSLGEGEDNHVKLEAGVSETFTDLYQGSDGITHFMDTCDTEYEFDSLHTEELIELLRYMDPGGGWQ